MTKKKNIEKRVLEHIKRNNLIQDNDKILVGVSGGIDSVSLLYLLLNIKKYFKNLSIGVAHVNYRLRGEDSEKDQKLVEKICKKNNIELFIHTVKNPEELKKSALQVKARNIRYKFYDDLCEKENFSKIALAHNADDNAETVLLNVFRGTGIDGLKGISVRRERIIRPILFLRRKELLEYARENKIKFRHDKTNFTSDYNRNYIRLKIIPKIQKKINNKCVENINQLSFIISDFCEFIDEYVKNAVNSVYNKTKTGEISLDIKKLNNYINYIKEKVILSVYYQFTKEALTYNKILKILHLLEGQSGKKLQLSSNIVLWKDRDKLIFKKIEEEKDRKILHIKVGESISIEGKKIKIDKVSKSTYTNNRNVEYIDANKVSDNFIIRKWQSGDNFYPFGLKGKKKLSDFLTDEKITSSEKKDVLVLLNEGKIVWVIGYRLDDRFKCTKETKSFLKLEIK